MTTRMTKYEAAIGEKVTEKMLDHELDRFIDMTEEKLVKRLGKITTPIKLEACRQMAAITKIATVYYEARDRLEAIC